jgi:hypothetical protein
MPVVTKETVLVVEVSNAARLSLEASIIAVGTYDVANLKNAFNTSNVIDIKNLKRDEVLALGNALIQVAGEMRDDDTIVEELVISGTVTKPTAIGGDDGAIDVTVSGGVAPYTYAWNNGDTTQDVAGLVAGSYTVTVTDSNGDSETQGFLVEDPEE